MIYLLTVYLPEPSVINALKKRALIIYAILNPKKKGTNASKRTLIIRKNKELETKLNLSKLLKLKRIFTRVIVVVAMTQVES